MLRGTWGVKRYMGCLSAGPGSGAEWPGSERRGGSYTGGVHHKDSCTIEVTASVQLSCETTADGGLSWLRYYLLYVHNDYKTAVEVYVLLALTLVGPHCCWC